MPEHYLDNLSSGDDSAAADQPDLLQKVANYKKERELLDPIANRSDRLILRIASYRLNLGQEAKRDAEILADRPEVEFQDLAVPGDRNFPGVDPNLQPDISAVPRGEDLERAAIEESEQQRFDFLDENFPIPEPNALDLIPKPSERDAALEADIDFTKREGQGFIGERDPNIREIVSDVLDEHTPPVVKLAYNRSITGTAHELVFGNQAFDMSGYEPDAVTDIVANILMFTMPVDALTLGVGARAGQLAVRTAVDSFGPGIVRKLIANGVAEEAALKSVMDGAQLLLRSGSNATALGTYDAAGKFAEGGDLGEIAEAGVHGGTLGAILGYSGFITRNRSLATQLGSETAFLGAGGAALEGRLPETADFTNAAAMIAGLRLTHLVTGTVKREADINRRIQEWLLEKTMEGKPLEEATEEMFDMSEKDFKQVVGEDVKLKTQVPVEEIDPITKEPIKKEIKEISDVTKRTDVQEEIKKEAPAAEPGAESPVDRPGEKAQTEPQGEITPESVAKEHGLTFNGMQERVKKPPIALFTDPKTKSTIAIGDLSKAGEEVAASRAKFESVVPEPKDVVTKHPPKKIAKFEQQVESIRDKVAEMRQPSTQNPTRKRNAERASKIADADNLDLVANALEGLAADMKAGKGFPAEVEGITSRAQVEYILTRKRFPEAGIHTSSLRSMLKEAAGKKGVVDIKRELETLSRGNNWEKLNSKQAEAVKKLKRLAPKEARFSNETIADNERMTKAGITSANLYDSARRFLFEYTTPKTAEEIKAEEIDKEVKEQQLRKEPGFFVTPDPVVAKMVERADIKSGDAVLEPSAGLGNIADRLPKDQTKVLEFNTTRNALLKKKGHNVVGSDFLEHTGEYDKIVMNPPFEKSADIVHVRHAYDLLKPGGKIVAIMSEGPFFRNDTKATEFRDWLEDKGTSEKLSPGAFKSSGTGVSTRLVEIEKPTVEAEKPKSTEKLSEPAADSPKEAVAEILEGKRESKIGFPEFKKKMTIALNKAIAKAPKAEDAKVIEGEFETISIHIPGDGDFVIDNTKDALKATRDLLSKKLKSGVPNLKPLPKPRQKIPHESKFRVETIGEQSIPVPASPRSFKVPQQITMDAEVKYITDGRYMISKDLDPGNIKIDFDAGGKRSAIEGNKIFSADLKKPVLKAEEIGRLRGEGDQPAEAIYRSVDGKQLTHFDAQYIDWFHKIIPDFSLRIDPTSFSASAVVMSGNKKVGVLMPRKATTQYKVISNVPATKKPAKKKTPGDVEGSPDMKRRPALPERPITDKPVKGTTRADVVNHFRKAFDIPIRTGRFRQQAVGIYKIHGQVVRSKEANDLSTISHEVGHHLEHTLLGGGGNRSALRKAPIAVKKELTQMGKDLYGSRKPNSGYRSEGFAEFISFWTTTDDVARRAPESTKWFNDVFLKDNPETAIKLQEGQRLAKAWREQGAVNRVYSNIDMTGKEKPASIKDRILEGGLRLNTLFADDLAPLEFVEKKIRGVKNLDPTRVKPSTSPTMLARSVAQTSTGKARMMALHGTFDFAGTKTGPGLREVLAPVSDDVASAVTYSYAKRAVELHNRGINPGITIEDAKFTVKELETPERAKAHEGLTAFENRVIDYLVDSGGMSLEAAEAMLALNPSHIPLKRAIGQNLFTGGGGKKLAGVPSPIKRIKGSGLAIRNPYASIIENTATIINFADKARVGRALVQMGEEGKGAGKWIEKIPAPQQANQVSLERMKQQLEAAGVDLKSADLDQILTVYSNAGLYKGRDNIVSFWRDGKREFYELDPLLYKALKGIDDITLPPMMEFMFAKPARAVRLGATGLNAGFGLITNPLRDAFTFGLQSEFTSGSPGQIAKGFVTRLNPGHKMNMLWKRSGADFSQFLGMDRKQLLSAVDEVLASTKKKQAMNVVDHPIEAMKDLFSITEASPRLAEFEAAYKKGEELYGKGSSSAQIMANLASSEVTVNFRRAGVYGRYINQIIPFWNAQVQGVSRFARFAKTNPVKAAIKGITSLTIPTIGMWMMNKDEDWYRDMQPYQRYGFWNIPTGKNEDGSDRIVRIPRPFEWGVVFSAIPEMTLDYMYSKDKSIINEGLAYMAEQTVPIGLGHIPTTIKIPIELGANFDYFRDRPIDPHFEVKYKEPQDRFSPYTTETAKFLGEQFGMSPRKIDHLVSSSTGGLGRDLTRSFEAAAGIKSDDRTGPGALPIVGRLFQHTQTPETREKRLKFEKTERLSKLRNTFKAGRIEEAREDVEAWNRKHPKHQIKWETVVNLTGQRKSLLKDMVDEYLSTDEYPDDFEDQRKEWNKDHPKMKISKAHVRGSRRRRAAAAKKRDKSNRESN